MSNHTDDDNRAERIQALSDAINNGGVSIYGSNHVFDEAKRILSNKFYTGQVLKFTANDLNILRIAFITLIDQVERLQSEIERLENRQQKKPSPTTAADEGNV